MRKFYSLSRIVHNVTGHARDRITGMRQIMTIPANVVAIHGADRRVVCHIPEGSVARDAQNVLHALNLYEELRDIVRAGKVDADAANSALLARVLAEFGG